MSRKLASIRKISSLKPIKGADRIELARIGGWDVIVKKDEFQEEDLCVYCEIDSVLPDEPEFEFLRDKEFRIKTLKMRGVISQGICFPLSILPPWIASCGNCPYEWTEGEDVTEILGVTLFDQEEEGVFPYFIPRTKEERVQNLSDSLHDIDDIEFIITEKLDGTSVTYYLKDEKFGICSRNCEIEEEGEYGEIAKRYNIEENMRKVFRNFAIQGEIVGPKVNKNRLKLDELDFYVFHIFDIDNQEFIEWDSMISIIEEMGLKTVPVVEDNITIDNLDVDQIIQMGDGKSMVNQKVRREGLVFRSRKNQSCQFGKVSFKAISNKYLLKT